MTFSPLEPGLFLFARAAKIVGYLLGPKSRLVYMTNENGLTHAQTALVWQHEFYKWLAETL